MSNDTISAPNSLFRRISESFNIRRDFYKIALFIELLIIFVTFGVLTNGTFLSARNLSNLFMQGCTCSIIAITMMLVIVSRNADLSAGLAVAFMGMVAAQLQVYAGLGPVPTIILTLVCGLMIGLWHGYWIGYIGLPAFIVTYATQLIFKGGILLVGGGSNVGPATNGFSVFGKGYLPTFLTGNFGKNGLSIAIMIAVIALYWIYSFHKRTVKKREGFPLSSKTFFAFQLIAITAVIGLISSIMIRYKGFSYGFMLLVALGVLFAFVVNNTSFGRYVFAIGGNTEAAKMSGINIRWTVMFIFILHSIVVSIASIVYLGRIGQATSMAGTGFEFIAITGCVVGGTSILGGSGTVLGAVIGTMLMMGLDNGMSLLNMGTTYQYIIKGLILMLAIAMDVISKKSKN